MMCTNVLMYISMFCAGFCLAPMQKEVLGTSIGPLVTECAAGFGNSAFGTAL